jgi:transcriptional regulator with XRE-family HTH domain
MDDVSSTLLVIGMRRDEKKIRDVRARDRLLLFMGKRGWNAPELARRSGVAVDTIRRYCQPEQERGIGIEVMLKLSDALQCDVKDFYAEETPTLAPYRPVAFRLDIVQDVDDELKRKAGELVEQLNREYAAWLKTAPVGAKKVPESAGATTSYRAGSQTEKDTPKSRREDQDRPYQRKPSHPPRKH